MEIRYRNTLEDAVAFNRYHCAHSDEIRRQRNRAAIHLPIVLGVLLAALAVVTQHMEVAFCGAVFIALYVFFIRRAFRTGLRKTVEKMYQEQDASGFICEHVLEIDEDGILEKTDVSERRDKWIKASGIAEDDGYAFIYVGVAQAHVVPRERIIDGDFDRFVETARSYWEKAHADSREGGGPTGGTS